MNVWFPILARTMLVSPIHLRVLASTLDMEGFGSASVLAECGIDAVDQFDDTQWLPAELYDRMIQSALRWSRTPSLGLRFGASIANQTYGLLPKLVMHMPHLRQGLEDITRYALLLLPRQEIALIETGDTAQITLRPILSHGPGGLFRTEFLASSLMQMLRYAGVDANKLIQVNLTHASPGNTDAYLQYLGIRPLFHAQESCIIFKREILDAPIRWHDKVQYIETRTQAELSLAASRRQLDAIQVVKRALIEAFPQALTITDVAAQLGMSERSLRRRLAGKGVNHSELLRECRQLIAEQRLAEPDTPLKQIAEALGFSSVTCFHRAFKGWTGVTPSEWRWQQRLSAQQLEGRTLSSVV